jgi:hypothetical protein
MWLQHIKLINPGFPCMSRSVRKALSVGMASLSFLLLANGCAAGSSSGSTPPSDQAVNIISQPASMTAPLGRTATFSVTASGAAPLKYQWVRNGSEIAGATEASYTTSAVSSVDSGSTFQVKISNANSSISSNVATLTAGARAPAIGDLRYLLAQQVTLPGFGQNGAKAGVVASGSETIRNAVGTPLELGSFQACSPASGCAWGFSALFLPQGMTGLTMWYKGGNLSYFDSDLQSIIASNTVITSLDLEPATNAYGISWVQTGQSGGFDYRLEIVPPAEIQSTVAQDGAESRIITAASFDAKGQAYLVSYGWQGDRTTAYDVKTVIVAPQDAATAAIQLAGAGYAISAFGGNDTRGYVLVGTKVVGDTLPRPVNVTTPAGYTPASNRDSGNFTQVLALHEPYGSPSAGYTSIQEQ